MNESRRTFRRDALTVLLAYGSSVVILIVTAVATARLLGPAGRGDYALATLLPVMIVTVIGLGLAPATTFLTARGESDDAEILSVVLVGSPALGVCAAAAVAVPLTTVGGSWLGNLSSTDLVLAVVAVPFLFLAGTSQAYLLGKRRFPAYNAAVILQAAAPLTLIVGTHVVTGIGVTSAIAATVAGLGLSSMLSAFWCYHSLGCGLRRPSSAYVTRLLRYALRLGLFNVFNFLGYRVDLFILAAFATAGTVGLYSIAVATAEKAWLLSYAASTVLFSRLAGERDEAARLALTPQVTRAVLLLTAMVALALALASEWLLDLVYSASFRQASGALVALLPGIVFLAAARILANDIAARDRPGANSVVSAVSLGVNVIMNLVLIPRHGAVGAAWASTASYGVFLILTLAVYLRLSGNAVRSTLLVSWKDIRLVATELSRIRPYSRATGGDGG